MTLANDLGDKNASLPASLYGVIVVLALSQLSVYIQRLAVGWCMWEATKSPTMLAAISFADLIPNLLLSGHAGAMLDRRPVRFVYFGALLASGTQALTLGLLSSQELTSPAVLLGMTAVFGACSTFSQPARTVYLNTLVEPSNYTRVVALNSLASNLSFFAGPLIGGAVMVRFDSATAFYVVALLYLPSAWVALRFPGKYQPTAPQARETLIQSIRSGILFARKSTEIFRVLSAFFATALLIRGFITLAPSVAERGLNGSVQTLSYLTSSMAAGGVLGSLLMARSRLKSTEASLYASITISALAIVFYTSGTTLGWAVAGSALLGFGLALNNVEVSSTIQVNTPREYQGRMNSLYNLIFKAGPAFGTFIFGVLSTKIGLSTTAVVAAVITLFFCVIHRVVFLRRMNGVEEQSRAGF